MPFRYHVIFKKKNISVIYKLVSQLVGFWILFLFITLTKSLNSLLIIQFIENTKNLIYIFAAKNKLLIEIKFHLQMILQ